MSTLGEDLPREIARVRDEIMPIYYQIGQAGAFALAMIRADLDRASKVMIEQRHADMLYRALCYYTRQIHENDADGRPTQVTVTKEDVAHAMKQLISHIEWALGS